MSGHTRLVTFAAALAFAATILAPAPGAAAVTAATGWAVHSIPTPGTVQGGVVRQGGATFVGQGAFGAGLEQVIRLDAGGATTIATGFNSLGGFAIDAAGTLYVTDNGGNLRGRHDRRHRLRHPGRGHPHDGVAGARRRGRRRPAAFRSRRTSPSTAAI